MSADACFDARTFVRTHGVVLLSARGPVPSLATAISGETIRGSWWAHPSGKAIYAAAVDLAADPEVLRCRLILGKISFVHRRLWPAFARLALDGVLPPERSSRVIERHAEGGRHESSDEAFSAWVPPEVLREAQDWTAAAARTALGLETE